MNNKGSIERIGTIIFFVLIGLIILIGLGFVIYYAESYLNLKDVIDKCNKDFGQGNWTFKESKDQYTCSSYNYYSYISTTTETTKECLVNGVKTKCQ